MAATPARPVRRAPLLREIYGLLLRRRRLAAGRTLADVAAEAGVSMAYLSEVERGLKEPSSEVLAAICVALDSSVVQLVGAAHRELRDLALAEADAGAAVLDLASRRAERHVRATELSGPAKLSGPAELTGPAELSGPAELTRPAELAGPAELSRPADLLLLAA
jgi:transcriptional regulator with XRE-family HTH domain